MNRGYAGRLFFAAVSVFAATAAEIRLQEGKFVVAGWPEAAHVPAERYRDYFLVTVDQPGAPLLLGAYRLEAGTLVFTPRFPPQAGMVYLATLKSNPPVEARFEIPKTTSAAPRVEAVYPSAGLLPENLLKLYVHFSRPMARGEAYRHLRLTDGAGRPVELPFLEIEQELWDPAARRLTLVFDPGRIKRGLVPNQEVGLALEPGKEYVFSIDALWPDALGTPLAEKFEKRFRVSAGDRTPPLPKDWKILVPPAGSREPLSVEFAEPMDHALAERLLWVESGGQAVDGTVELEAGEVMWRFRPAEAWRAASYVLVVDKALEDLAGNRIGRPFDVDIFEKVDREISKEFERVPFTVR